MKSQSNDTDHVLII